MNLSARLRPQNFEEFVGQNDIAGKDAIVQRIIKSRNPFSLIFWGPPGSGKTTLANIIANELRADFHAISAVEAGKADLTKIIEVAKENLKNNIRTILFIDEIHRWNKAQQDALLPYVENGTINLIGATTENPSFEVIAPLLSRSQVYVLDTLDEKSLRGILTNAVKDDETVRHKLSGADGTALLSEEAESEIIRLSGGDARVMLNALEIALDLTGKKAHGEITRDIIREAYQTRHFKYDRSGEEHYNSISAFIKSVRGSDPDAAVYYLARMLEAGEDPKFVARRLIILASEDIGNAEPYAISLAAACFTAVDYVGMPEARIILAQATTYLASCPKSNASYISLEKAAADVREQPYLPVPLHLRNAPTQLMKQLGYHKDYKYAHDFNDHFVEQQYLPDVLRERIYYEPTEIGREAVLKKYLDSIWKKRKK